LQFDMAGEPDRQRAVGEAVLGRGELAPDRVPPSPSSVSPALSSRLATATTSPRQPWGCSVGSQRNAPDNTDMPSSSPIKWQGLYIAACPSGAETSADDRPGRNRAGWPVEEIGAAEEHGVVAE